MCISKKLQELAQELAQAERHIKEAQEMFAHKGWGRCHLTKRDAQNEVAQAVGIYEQNLDQIIQLVAVGTVLCEPVGHLGLSNRANNVLRSGNIYYIGQLVRCKHLELRGWPNLGRVTLTEIEEALAKRGLYLGMKIPDWKRPDD